ncbi:glycoside hydrolase family 92 protein [Phanerochaete carnosa HHB-10118-sp]|uniref:Glycoside hydrolase family 92 protein n=1 Tax=Phanerochaete carnosa (strain HHB-10118-sp) TaxID=650164 RepID=K5W0L8_PHACS|nr:glycoside hydrolase family 92 protein [Phanerochaete carnosa HHB-10118-sp]EKM57353.1 glycoside hydrolase family 92 protein [Phanerochaete carnosa HHB-10118-sp]
MARQRSPGLVRCFLLSFSLLSSAGVVKTSLAASTATDSSGSATHSVLPSTSLSSFPSAPTQTSASIASPASLVNLFIGTTNGGHVFPGATLPHGMTKAGMDTDSPGNQAGYDANPTFNVTGFSQLHDDGTGGGVSLSLFKVFPFASCGPNDKFEQCPTSLEGRKVLRNVLDNGSPDDFAEPGYFSTNLSTGIRVELTTTRRTALHRYTFPAGTVNPRIMVDITNDGEQSSTNPEMLLNATTARVTGAASFAASFGPGRYRAFTCVDFMGDGFELGPPTQSGAWLGNSGIQQTTNLNQLYFGFVSELGALFTFAPKTDNSITSIFARVGVSFISADQACANAESEIPDFNFDGARQAAFDQWDELLGRIQVDTTGVDANTTQLFYSSLYRTHISPADYTGENPRWNSTEPYYDSFYCNWDTFRTLYSLMALHDPVNFSRIVRGLLNIQQHEGWLPECRGATAKQFIQGGSNGDPIVAEFFVKYHEHLDTLNVSATALYEALIADAEVQPPNWDLQGRQVNIWKTLGYIPSDVWEPSGTNTKQVSRALEYAFGDFAISQVAKIMGNTADGAKYAQRAQNFVNNWNPNVTVPGREDIKGMMQPRFLNGTFNFTDPRHCSVNDPLQSTCFLDAVNTDGFYESSPIVYSQFVPQDTAKLIELQGGTEKFVDRLNFIFEEHYFDETDEPSQQIPFMYHYANQPGLSTQTSRQTIAQFFNTSVNGLPGNDDSGAMGSYVAFYLLGMYPVPATRQFLLSSPYFPEVSFTNPIFGNATTIRVKNFSGNPANGTGGNVFVKSVTIDGQPWKSNCFIDWDAFQTGSTIELEVTTDISVSCGANANSLPPSLSTGGFD